MNNPHLMVRFSGTVPNNRIVTALRTQLARLMATETLRRSAEKLEDE